MVERRRFTQQDFDDRRWNLFRMAGVTLTDRCPVGCAHCSVSAILADSGPESNPAFLEHVRQVGGLDPVEVVIITGGEPFFHVDTLYEAVRLLREGGKRVVVHTSGYWGDSEAVVVRAREIVSELDSLVMGVDLFHRIGVSDNALQQVVQLARDLGAWLVVQVLEGPGQPDHRAYAEKILTTALGTDWHDHAEIVINRPLNVGRAVRLKSFREPEHSAAGWCDLVKRPMLRFDREVTACCNEAVLRGAGPQGLRKPIERDVPTALAALAADPLVDLVRTLPTGVAYELVSHVAGVPAGPVNGKCDACWRTGTLLEGLSSDQQAKVRELATAVAGTDVRAGSPGSA